MTILSRSAVVWFQENSAGGILSAVLMNDIKERMREAVARVFRMEMQLGMNSSSDRGIEVGNGLLKRRVYCVAADRC